MNIILTIVGIALAIIGIWVTIRRKYPGKITFFKEECIGLFDSIVRNFPELLVSYQNSPISENIVLLKGSFLNAGSKDISPDMVEEKLTVVLPEGFKWLQGKIISSSPEVRASILISGDNKLIFNMGLFRCKEYIRFEALAEVPFRQEGNESSPAKRLLSAIKIIHRICDTQKIGESPLPPAVIRVNRGDIILATLMSLLLGIFLFYQSGETAPGRFKYLINTESGKTIEIRLRPKADGKIRIEGVKEKYAKEMNVNDFFGSGKGIITIEKSEMSEISWFMTVATIFFWLYALVVPIVRKRKSNRLRKLLAISNL